MAGTDIKLKTRNDETLDGYLSAPSGSGSVACAAFIAASAVNHRDLRHR